LLNRFSLNASMALSLSIMMVAPFLLGASADGLVQLRPLNGTSTTASSADTSTTTAGRISVEPWRPDGATTSTYTSSPSTYSANASSPYTSGVSVFAGDQKLTIRLNERISSQDIKPGDTVSATLEAPLMSGGNIIAPAGSEVLGSVVDASTAKRAGIHGEVDLRFYTIVKPNGERVAIDAIVVTEHGGSQIRSNNYVVDAARGVGVAAIGTAGGALAGTALGAIFSAAGSGAALGTAVGAAAGISYALWRTGKVVELPKGSLLQLQARDPQMTKNPTS
jgi:hypothetical protein